MNAIHESSLHSALISGNASAFRRCALELLGINCGDDDAEESSSDGIASDSNSESLAGQSTSSSSSEDSDDGGQETCTDVPVLPPPVPCERRVRDPINAKGKMKFCSAFQSRCCGDHPAAAEVPQAPGLLHKNIEDEDGDESTVASSEDFSDISDDSDLDHLTVDPHKSWTTEQDEDQERIEHVAELLRKNPLLPYDPADPSAETDWCDVQSGVALPRAHCGFKGCKCVFDTHDWETALKFHVRAHHLKSMQLPERDQGDFYDFYEAAIQWKAQQTMPAVGVSIDRRSFRHVNDTFNDDNVYNLMCMVCAQSKTHTGLMSVRRLDGSYIPLSETSYRKGEELIGLWKKNADHFDHNFGFRRFMERYGQDWKVRGRNDEDLREFGPTRWEWRRLFKMRGRTEPFELLCCPEDIKCDRNHDTSQICDYCDVPVCSQCWSLLMRGRNVPMALSNDNMWGYVADIVT